jgi:hypothetical protein
MLGGGARVLRTFTIGERRVLSGEILSPEEVRGINLVNRRALVDNHQLEIIPRAATNVPQERFLMSTEKNKYNVIEGRMLNTEPLSREEATKLVRGEQ